MVNVPVTSKSFDQKKPPWFPFEQVVQQEARAVLMLRSGWMILRVLSS